MEFKATVPAATSKPSHTVFQWTAASGTASGSSTAAKTSVFNPGAYSFDAQSKQNLLYVNEDSLVRKESHAIVGVPTLPTEDPFNMVFAQNFTTKRIDLRNVPNTKRIRPTIGSAQLEILEFVFRLDPFPDVWARICLQKKLGLAESTIKNWFKNRRAKERRKNRTNPSNTPTKHPRNYSGNAPDFSVAARRPAEMYCANTLFKKMATNASTEVPSSLAISNWQRKTLMVEPSSQTNPVISVAAPASALKSVVGGAMADFAIPRFPSMKTTMPLAAPSPSQSVLAKSRGSTQIVYSIGSPATIKPIFTTPKPPLTTSTGPLTINLTEDRRDQVESLEGGGELDDGLEIVGDDKQPTEQLRSPNKDASVPVSHQSLEENSFLLTSSDKPQMVVVDEESGMEVNEGAKSTRDKNDSIDQENHPLPMTATIGPLHPPIDFKTDDSLKPPFSYSSLIYLAMKSKKRAVSLAEIYAYIKENYAFYKNTRTNWQNIIRHNLSLNSAFVKVPRSKNIQGKGGYWQIHPDYVEALDQALAKWRHTRKPLNEKLARVLGQLPTVATTSSVLLPSTDNGETVLPQSKEEGHSAKFLQPTSSCRSEPDSFLSDPSSESPTAVRSKVVTDSRETWYFDNEKIDQPIFPTIDMNSV